MLELLLERERQNDDAYHARTWSSAVDALLYADRLERADRLRWANRGRNDDVERRRIWREERDKLVADAQREVERQKELKENKKKWSEDEVEESEVEEGEV